MPGCVLRIYGPREDIEQAICGGAVAGECAGLRSPPMHSDDHNFRRLLCTGLGLLVGAVSLTLLGGGVLAFDKTLWPFDAYVTYAGHVLHVAAMLFFCWLVLWANRRRLARGRQLLCGCLAALLFALIFVTVA